MGDRYKHLPLDLTREEIRLLNLDTNGKGQICGTLHHVCITEAPPYQAVSYVWGPPSPTNSIWIDGRPLEIRRNLHEFLQVYVTKPELQSYQYLWIDQICIAQGVLNEKNHQVHMMGDIFRKAEATLMWLGMHFEGNSFTTLFQKMNERSFWEHWRRDPRPDFSSIESFLDILLLSPYWTRRWVVQEIFLSKTAVVVFGRDDVTLFGLLEFWLYLRNEEPITMRKKDRSLFYPLTLWHNLNSQKPPGLNGVSEWFLPILFEFGGACEDPRDHFYALQNILPPSLRIDVDYAKSIRDVFLDAAEVYYDQQVVQDLDLWPYLNNLAVSMGLIASDQNAGLSRDLDQYSKELTQWEEHSPNGQRHGVASTKNRVSNGLWSDSSPPGSKEPDRSLHRRRVEAILDQFGSVSASEAGV